MWIPKGLSNSAFATQPDGQVFFYPFGVITKGFIIDNPQRRSKLENHWKAIWALTFAAVLAIILIPDLLVKGLILITFVSIVVAWNLVLTRGLSRTPKRRKIDEMYRQVAEAYPQWVLYAMAMACGLTTLGCGYLLTTDEYVIGAMGLTLFGVGTVLLIYIARLKKRPE